MFSRSFSRKVRTLVFSSSVAVILSSVSSFANSWDFENLWWLYTTKTSSTNMNCKTDVDWVSQSDDQLYNNKPYKLLRLYADNSNSTTGTDVYYTIQSVSYYGADPICYYSDNRGSVSYLSDDEGGSNQLKAVIHFRPGLYQNVELYFQHYSATDLLTYRITPTVSSTDPGWTGCYYLEVYPDGTLSTVWH